MQVWKVWWIAAIACSWPLSLISGTSTGRLPKINLVNHYEPLSYNPGPLREKHDRIARGIIYEPQIRNLQINFRAYDRDFHLHLWPSRSTFSAGVKFKIGGKDTNAYDPATFYQGEVQGDESSHVTGHVIDGVFSGVIRTTQETYHVEKTKSYFRDRRDLSFHSFIYRETDVEFPRQPLSCGISGPVQDWMRETQSSAVPMHDPRDNPRTALLTKLLGKRREKRALTSTGGNFCHMRVSVDHLFFDDIGGGDRTDTFAEVVTIFNLVQDIYMKTDFDMDGQQDFITPSIQEFNILQQSDPRYRFGAPSISVNDFLDLWSQEDHTQFCLAMLLTNRDFDDGVLGLAWVAQPPGGNRGGICEGRVRLSVGQRSLNTAIVTFTNYGNQQPRAVSVITIAHELGHNFGSSHDPSSTDTCSPGSSGGGNYIMYPRATNGQQSNNNEFSPCSRREIRDVLVSSKSDCFSSEAFCGNGIIEEGEECDQDTCCNDTICMLLPGKSCSSQQQCCDNNCTVITTPMVCRAESDCAEQASCDGTNGACPQSTPRPAGTLCNNGSNVCDTNGNCVGSYCLQFPGLQECQCTTAGGFDDNRLCDVCCLYQGSCETTFVLAGKNNDPNIATIEARTLEPGRSCNNFEGYCSQKDEAGVSRCIVVDNEETLNDLIDLLSIDTLNAIVAWLSVYWWVAIIVILGLLGLFILLQVTYRKRKPLKRRLSRARNSLRGRPSSQGGREAGRNQGGVREERRGRRRRRDEGRRQISPDMAIRRLCTFFPTADSGTVRDVIRQSSSESKAVRRMLDLGYPMKKVPIPHA